MSSYRSLLCAASLRLFFGFLIASIPWLAEASGVSVRFDFSNPDAAPFPTDRYTRLDFAQRTFRQVRLPHPNCTVRPSDCADVDVLNTLDGFNTQPRITVPFTGAINVNTVNSDTLYLVSLGDTLTGAGFGDKVGINQIVWDPATNTLAVESDELLAEHARYLLVVTNGIRDAAGDAIEGGRFARFRDDLEDRDERGDRNDRDDFDRGDYRKALRDGEPAARHSHARIVALSLFTTQSATVDLEKIRKHLKNTKPGPTNFMIGNGGTTRAVFTLADIAAIQFKRQVGTAPTFATSFLPTPALNIVPGAIAKIAFGQYRSPDYETAGKYIPATPTLLGQPQPQGANDLLFEVFLPAGPKPVNGWPVAMFGHGFLDNMYGAPWAVASVLASQGIATVAINVVGHGGGALGTLTVLKNAGAPVILPAGGRGIDQDGNGTIDSIEGVNAVAPRTLIGSRDGLRQTVIDLMQLVRQIEAGIDIDGDGHADLDSSLIYYSGQSFGGIYGTILLGVEPNIQAGVPNVAGGSVTEVARLGAFRPLVGITLATRVPSLINVADPSGIAFNENIPLRNLPPVTNNVAGAFAIQTVLERNEWAQQAGNPVSYASYIRKHPMAGNAPKPIIFQFAKGDTTVPNPTSTAIVRAGDFKDRTTYFRNDLAHAANPLVPKGPHTFLTNVGIPAAAPYAIAAQSQIAVFFKSNGTIVIDPDGAAPFFETPIVGPLPEGLNFIP